LPGNKIIGYVGQAKLERGITIHLQNCHNIKQILDLHPERFVEVNWDKNANKMSFSADIFIESSDRMGILKNITTLLSAEKINIINLRSNNTREGLISIYMTLEVSSVSLLDRILDRLSALPNVNIAKRMSNTL
jgi:GTP pyrophosphokinase